MKFLRQISLPKAVFFFFFFLAEENISDIAPGVAVPWVQLVTKEFSRLRNPPALAPSQLSFWWAR